MVGSAIKRKLLDKENVRLICKSRLDLDLTKQEAVEELFQNYKIDEVIIAAAKVGGIFANNTYPAEFIYENLQIQNNIIHTAHKHNIQKLLFLASSCIYPKSAQQPMTEDALLMGKLEPTNEPYAIAKIAGIKMCESYNRQYGRDYRTVMPTNLYGPGDSYHPENSHVVPGLIRRFHEAKTKKLDQVVVWGSGKPRREFLYVDDMAEASIFIHNLDFKTYKKHINPMLSQINVGSGKDMTINELAMEIKKVVGYNGNIIFDTKKPDGAQRKLLDVSLIKKLGWSPKVSLRKGLKFSYDEFIKKNS